MNLHKIEAIDDYVVLTALGKDLAGLAVEPGLAVALQESITWNVAHEMLTLVAMLTAIESSKLFFSPKGCERAAEDARNSWRTDFRSDHMDLIVLFNEYARIDPHKRQSWCSSNFINSKVMLAAAEARHQLWSALRRYHPDISYEFLPPCDYKYSYNEYLTIIRCLYKGYPRQIALRQDRASYPYTCFPAIDENNVPEVRAAIDGFSSAYGCNSKEVLYHSVRCTNPYTQPTVTATLQTVSDITIFIA